MARRGFMKKKKTAKILNRAYSSYHGKVHIPYITTKPTIFSDEDVYMNSVCAGHVVAGVPETDASAPAKANNQL